MQLDTRKHGDVTVVVLQTEVLDASNAKSFKTAIAPVLQNSLKVVFDMNQVKFVDSSGCGTLLSCLRQLNSLGGDLKLCCVQKPVRTLFELVRMHRITEIFDSSEEAVKAF